MVKQLHIYIIHAATLPDRKDNIDKLRLQLAQNPSPQFELAGFHMIDAHDPGQITAETVKTSVNYTQIPVENPLAYLNVYMKNMHVNQLSNALKHFKAIEMIAAAEDDEAIHIVLEDDVVYDSKLVARLERVFTIMDGREHGFVLLGLPAPHKVEDAKLLPLHTSFRVMPVVDSYIIHRDVAKKVMSMCMPIKFMTNVHLDYVLKTKKVNIYQSAPNVFLDGSKYGTCVSSQGANNTLLFNSEYVAMKTIVEKEKLVETDDKTAQVLIDTSVVKQHPDFRYLVAKYLTKKQQYKEAHAVYVETYNALLRRSCVVNHDSLLLKDFIRLYSKLQNLTPA